MSSQNLEKWALIAEIVGGVAIVVTLAVVAFELHRGGQQTAQNTSALEIASYQDLIANISNLNETVISNPLLLMAIPKTLNDPDSLTEPERLAASFYYMSVFRHGDMAYFQFQRGAIDRRRLDSVMQIVTNRLQTPYVLDFWNNQKAVFVQEYQDYLDESISKGSTLDAEF